MLRKISPDELKTIIENHQHWLKEDCEGWETMRADLSGSDLRCSNLSGSNLSYSNLSYSNLRYSNLSGSDLRYSNLSGSDLRGSNLSYSNLSGSNLSGAKNVPFVPYSCPDVGSFIGYKKAKGLIVELEILSDARRCSATGRKCRCDKAKVLSIQNKDGSIADVKSVNSDHDPNFVYKVGEIVEEPAFCEDRWQECAPGIHFFINRQEAVDY